MSWVRVPPEAVFFTALGVLCCFALFCFFTLLASFFLPSHLSFIAYMYIPVQAVSERAQCVKGDHSRGGSE